MQTVTQAFEYVLFLSALPLFSSCPLFSTVSLLSVSLQHHSTYTKYTMVKPNATDHFFAKIRNSVPEYHRES